MIKISRAFIVATSLALACLSCATQSARDSDWIRFSSSGMVLVNGAYFGTISKSGVVNFTIYEKGKLSDEYRAYLSRAECERLDAAVDEFVRKHGSEVWLATMTDRWENRIQVQDAKGVKKLVFGFDRELACYDLPKARSSVELWNTLLKTIESPGLRTADEQIICAEPRKPWPRETP